MAFADCKCACADIVWVTIITFPMTFSRSLTRLHLQISEFWKVLFKVIDWIPIICFGYLISFGNAAQPVLFCTTCGSLRDRWTGSCHRWHHCDSWNVVTAIILLNVLISLFSSAYSEVSSAFRFKYFTSQDICFLSPRSLMTQQRNT